ncbi:ricin-type beta-trefoil lectin domain protein [Streptomyces griseoviridis]|uniref:ricin-type beta-trefoil lectin domain protein n=1 Tax=Streptomyces griseoviridis TaxID=45398 RepID=UPI00345709AF
MELKGLLARLAGAGAAGAFASSLLFGTTASAQTASSPRAVHYQVVNGNSRNACLQVVITLATCDRSAKQVWTIAGGVFKNPATNQCLDGDGSAVYTQRCNTDGYQKWTTTSGSRKYIRHVKSGNYLHAGGGIGDRVGFRSSTGTASRWVIGRV